MTPRLVAVSNARLPYWRTGKQVLLLDTSTGQYYVVNMVKRPWMDGPESLAYRSERTGAWTPAPPVAGGVMDAVSAVADLTQRLQAGTLLSESEAWDLLTAMLMAEADLFTRYITPTGR